jgi:hypothetical protein
MLAATDQALVQTDPDDCDNDSSLLNNEDPLGKNITTETDSPNLHQKEKQKGNLKLRECPSCIELNSENIQLKEIVKKRNQFTTADNIQNINNNDGNIEPKILDFEFCKSYWEVSNYAKRFFCKGNNSEIYFHGKIDVSTGKVISSGFGRINKQQ